MRPSTPTIPLYFFAHVEPVLRRLIDAHRIDWSEPPEDLEYTSGFLDLRRDEDGLVRIAAMIEAFLAGHPGRRVNIVLPRGSVLADELPDTASRIEALRQSPRFSVSLAPDETQSP